MTGRARPERRSNSLEMALGSGSSAWVDKAHAKWIRKKKARHPNCAGPGRTRYRGPALVSENVLRAFILSFSTRRVRKLGVYWASSEASPDPDSLTRAVSAGTRDHQFLCSKITWKLDIKPFYWYVVLYERVLYTTDCDCSDLQETA